MVHRKAAQTADKSAERTGYCWVEQLAPPKAEQLVGLREQMSVAQLVVWTAGSMAEWTAEQWDQMKADTWAAHLEEWMVA